MALLTIGKAGVFEPVIFPTVGSVAVGALACVVLLRDILILLMAGQAVGIARMIEIENFPILRVRVAVHAAGRKARGSKSPHLLALRGLYLDVYPGVTAGDEIVIDRGILQVTGATRVHLRVLVRDLFPLGDAAVAHVTAARIMIGRVVIQVAGIALDHPLVIEFKGGPVVDVVAVVAGAGKVVRVNLILGQIVAALTVVRGIGVPAFFVTGQTLRLRVATGQRVD
jgi:hypothetical protein